MARPLVKEFFLWLPLPSYQICDRRVHKPLSGLMNSKKIIFLQNFIFVDILNTSNIWLWKGGLGERHYAYFTLHLYDNKVQQYLDDIMLMVKIIFSTPVQK